MRSCETPNQIENLKEDCRRRQPYFNFKLLLVLCSFGFLGRKKESPREKIAVILYSCAALHKIGGRRCRVGTNFGWQLLKLRLFLHLPLSLASSGSDCVSFPSTLVAPDHVGELLVGGVEPVVAHHAPQLAHRDLAVVVGVEERERLLQAVQLLTMTMAAGQRGLC